MQIIIPALVSGLGASITGGFAAFFTAFLITGISAAVLYAMQKPKNSGTGSSSSAPELLSRTMKSAVLPRRYIYGDPVVAGLLVYAGTPDNPEKKDLLYMVIVLASHKVSKIGEVYFGDKSARNKEFIGTLDSGDTDWVAKVELWSNSKTYSYKSVVKYQRLSMLDSTYESLGVWRRISNSSSTMGVPPPDDAENWEEFGKWYSIRRHYGGENQTVDSMLHRNPPSGDPNDVSDPTRMFEEDGLGYVNDTIGNGFIWDETMKLNGLSYIVVKLRFNADQKTYSGGVPNITARVFGFNNIYCPNSSPQYKYSKNPVWCIAHYICSPFGLDQGDNKTYNFNGNTHVTSGDLVNWDKLEDEASHCDEVILSDLYYKGTKKPDEGYSYAVLTAINVLTDTSVDFTSMPWYTYRLKRMQITALPANSLYPRVKIRVNKNNVYSWYIGCIQTVAKNTLTVKTFHDSTGYNSFALTTHNESWSWDGDGAYSGTFTAMTSADIGTVYEYGIFMEDSVRPRFELCGVVSADEKPISVISQMVMSAAGNVVWINGKYIINVGRYVEPVAAIYDEDFISALSVAPLHTRADLFNTIKGEILDKYHDSAVVEFPEVTDAEYIAYDDNMRYYTDLTYKFIDNQGQAQRASRIILNKFRSEMVLQGIAKYSLFPLTVSNRVLFYSGMWPYTHKQFIVNTWEFSPAKIGDSGGISLTLAEDKPNNYQIDVFDNTPNIIRESSIFTSVIDEKGKDLVGTIVGNLANLHTDGTTNVPEAGDVYISASSDLYNKPVVVYYWTEYEGLDASPTKKGVQPLPVTYSPTAQERYISNIAMNTSGILEISFTNAVSCKNSMDQVNHFLSYNSNYFDYYSIFSVLQRNPYTKPPNNPHCKTFGYIRLRYSPLVGKEDVIYCGWVTVSPSTNSFYVYKLFDCKESGWSFRGYEEEIPFVGRIKQITIMCNFVYGAGITFKDSTPVELWVPLYPWTSAHDTYKILLGSICFAYSDNKGNPVSGLSAPVPITSTAPTSYLGNRVVTTRSIYTFTEVILGEQPVIVDSKSYVPVYVSWSMDCDIKSAILQHSIDGLWADSPNEDYSLLVISDTSTNELSYECEILSSDYTSALLYVEEQYASIPLLLKYKTQDNEILPDVYTAKLIHSYTGLIMDGKNRELSIPRIQPNSTSSYRTFYPLTVSGSEVYAFVSEYNLDIFEVPYSYLPGSVKLWINGAEMYPKVASTESSDTWEFQETGAPHYKEISMKSGHSIPAGAKCLVRYARS